MATQRSPKISDLFALNQQLQEDRERRRADILRRDREIGKTLTAHRQKPVRQILAWLAKVTSDPIETQAGRIDNGIIVIGIILGAAGLLIGWGTAAAVFYYDGSHPVNVVHVLAVFVGFQLVLLVLLAVAFCPKRWMGWFPGFSSLQHVLSIFSPGRLQWLISRVMPQSHRQAFVAFMGKSRVHQRVYGDVHKWQIARWSQAFALAFNVGAILCCIYLVVFSDLAFSWSTTLQTEPDEFHRVTRLMSAPWASWLPEAEPSRELVAATRYFRFNAGARTQAAGRQAGDPEVLGGWWPFLVACLVTYGLIPRLLTYTLVSLRLSRSIRVTLRLIPGAPDLLDRLNQPMIQTQSPEPERTFNGKQRISEPSKAARIPLVKNRLATIAWAELPFQEEEIKAFIEDHLHMSIDTFLAAGGARTLDEDAQTTRAVAEQEPSATLIVIKAWEAPTMELADFIEDLRAALGDGRSIHVVPIGLDDSGNPALPKKSDRNQWRDHLSSIGDPWLQVIDFDQEPAP